MTTLTLEQIKKQYPEEWVVLGFDENTKDSIVDGNVLLHGKDYLELCYKSSELPKNFLTKIIYTGQTTHQRKWLKATRLSEKPQTI